MPTDEPTETGIDYGQELVSWVRRIADEIDDPASDLAALRAVKLSEADDLLERRLQEPKD